MTKIFQYLTITQEFSTQVLVNGKPLKLDAYLINNDNTYSKLRDLAKLFNIGVGFDASTSTVSIDTGADYTE